MAFLSEILNEEPGIPQKYKDEASMCLMCGEKTKKGGMWATQSLHTCVCVKCAPSLLDWHIDTLLDAEVINESNDIENAKKLTCDILNRYNRKKKKKIELKKNHM